MSATPSATASPETSKKEEPFSAKAIAKKVEQIPIAEEAITVAKKAEGNVPLKVSEEKPTAPVTSAPVHESAIKEEKAKQVEDASTSMGQKTATPRAPATEKVDAPKPGPKENVVKTSEKTANAPKLAEKMDLSNVSDKKEDGFKTLETKKSLPKVSEDKGDFPKKVEREGHPRSSEEKENIPKASETSWAHEQKNDFPKAPEKEDVAPKFSFPTSSAPPTSLAKPFEDKEPAPKSLEKPQDAPKASDAMFAAFMNPGAEKTVVSQANGNHKEEEKTGLVSHSKDGLSSAQPVSEPSAGGLFETPQAQQAEEEEW